jgi:hypothetical protein
MEAKERPVGILTDPTEARLRLPGTQIHDTVICT